MNPPLKLKVPFLNYDYSEVPLWQRLRIAWGIVAHRYIRIEGPEMTVTLSKFKVLP